MLAEYLKEKNVSLKGSFHFLTSVWGTPLQYSMLTARCLSLGSTKKAAVSSMTRNLFNPFWFYLRTHSFDYSRSMSVHLVSLKEKYMKEKYLSRDVHIRGFEFAQLSLLSVVSGPLIFFVDKRYRFALFAPWVRSLIKYHWTIAHWFRTEQICKKLYVRHLICYRREAFLTRNAGLEGANGMWGSESEDIDAA